MADPVTMFSLSEEHSRVSAALEAFAYLAAAGSVDPALAPATAAATARLAAIESEQSELSSLRDELEQAATAGAA